MAPAGPRAAVERVTATPSALAALAQLRRHRGALILYQSGGCCDGSVPVCLEQGDLRIGDGDVYLGSVGGCPVYIDDRQYEVWKHTQLIIDVGEGEPEGFSLPAADDRHFVTRSRVFSPGELAALQWVDARQEACGAERPRLGRGCVDPEPLDG